jgi:predicted O-methyltransferase YrrM
MAKRTLLTGALDDYAIANWLRDSDLKRRLREETKRLPTAGMQIAADQGQFMALMTRAIGARHAIEIGVFTGYSALSVAEALPPDGKLIACDVSTEWTSIGKRYWRESGLDHKIDLRIGPALDTLDALLRESQAGKFDMAFIDADKSNYDGYYERCLLLLRTGGLMMFDNVLWGGRVAAAETGSEDTQALRALNAKLHDDQRIDLALVPLGDGITLALKR